MTDEDEEYLKSVRQALAESVEFFRAEKKTERELWVVCQYLTNLDLCFSETELKSSCQDPPDVLFRDAQFEIKEILSKGRRRHQEYQERLRKATKSTSPSDLVEHFTPRDVKVSDVYELILAEATRLAAQKYPPAVRKTLDLLFYVNLDDVFGLVEAPFPDVSALEALEYRSVAFVMGRRSSTFVATSDSPNFIRAAIGKIVHRNTTPFQ
ncbi:DUF1780 domain-containing protein [Paraburkholderia dilworthii]|uniref:DUF1780 domain-containing protein n=1 Tax=Paraburkholderia dilworthii TaxID=948106 RepID=UPI00137681F7|nr:DUF1780 domain-containing protein [Paraburkholderia dilworthii]